MRCKFAPATTSTCPRSTNTTTLHIAHSHYHIFTWPYTHVPGNDLIQTQNQKHCKDSFHLLNWKLKLLLILNWKYLQLPSYGSVGASCYQSSDLAPHYGDMRSAATTGERRDYIKDIYIKMQDSFDDIYISNWVWDPASRDGRLLAISIACCLHYFFTTKS